MMVCLGPPELVCNKTTVTYGSTISAVTELHGNSEAEWNYVPKYMLLMIKDYGWLAHERV